jgi:hypothetical protein
MALFWNSPTNKIVRSHEALIIGLLVGLLVGALLVIVFVTVTVKLEAYRNPARICSAIENVVHEDHVTAVDSVAYSITGKIKSVQCSDGRTIDDF